MTTIQPKLGSPSTGLGNGHLGPDPEVANRARRRQFTASYKLRVLQEVDTCKNGALGALLRREGLYSSHLTVWRRQREQGLLDAFQPHRRGRPPKNPTTAELARLRHENERLVHKLAVAETVIEIQKKVSALLGITLQSHDLAERP